jgi:multicomponent Na+:H+ antiporter subunit D
VALTFASVLYLSRLVSLQEVIYLRLGDWYPPFGIVLAVDWLSIFMLLFMNLVGLSVVIYSVFKEKRGDGESPYFYPLLLFQIAGVNGALTTGDLFNLFVWFEVMLIASYALLAQGSDRAKIKGIPDYVVINILSSALFLFAIGLTYASYGTLNFAHLGQLVQSGYEPAWSTSLAVLFFLVFGTKAAVFPLYFWMFRAYPLASFPVVGLFGGLLTKVGIYSMLRVFPLMFPGEFAAPGSFFRVLLYLVGAASILFGVFGALSRHEWRDILSHHITSQIGYMVIGVALWSTAALAATIFYVVHNVVVKSCLFLIGGMTDDFVGSTILKKQGGLIYNIPFVGALFLTAGLALAGLPPLSGFFAKMTLFYSAFAVTGPWAYFAVSVGIIGGLFTLYSMIKIWRVGFLGEIDEERSGTIRGGLFVAPILLVVTSVLMGFFAGTVMDYARVASRQLKNPDQYIGTVMEGSPVDGLKPGEYHPEPPGESGHGSSGH